MKPDAMSDHPHGTELFLYVQSEPPLTQICAINTPPTIGSLGVEIGASFYAPPAQEVVGSNDSASQPYFYLKKLRLTTKNIMARVAFTEI